MDKSVIVVGGGAAGLMAAYELSAKGYAVIVVEAQNRLGGRMHTIIEKDFEQAIETGAEFIHGNLPLTFKLVKKAGFTYTEVGGSMINVTNGNAADDEYNDDKDWNELLKAMKKLKQDMTMQQFLDINFSDDKYAALRERVKGFAGGFDLADINKAGLFALRDEWLHEDEEQYRIDGGYIRLVEYLHNECLKNKTEFVTGCVIKQVNWQKENVQAVAADGRTFSASKIVITVPLSVLQSDENEPAHITFTPKIKTQIEAAKNIAFGNVIKFILQFDNNIWSNLDMNAGFIFSNEKIPVWWTQFPNKNGLITGWLGGPATVAYADLNDEALLDIALKSLSNIFHIDFHVLKQQLVNHHIINWLHAPFINGGYSYSLPQSAIAKELLQTPVDDTIYLAGEAVYSGNDAGTVEAALTSGRAAALLIEEAS